MVHEMSAAGGNWTDSVELILMSFVVASMSDFLVRLLILKRAYQKYRPYCFFHWFGLSISIE